MVDFFITAVYVVVTGLIGFVTAAVLYARWHYGTLERVKGLPAIIKPAFVGGSDIHVYKKIVHQQDSENVDKYGNIYGYYEGSAPHIYIADPELIRLIFIKDFDHFQNKRLGVGEHELIDEMLDALPYEKWKVVRSFISPTLTTGKIRSMSIQMKETIEDWMETLKLKQAKNEPFSPKRMYTALTSDVVARCGFGTKLNSLHDPDNIFAKQIANLTLEDEDPNFMLTVAHIFPFLYRLVPMFPSETLYFFDNVLRSVMATRRTSNVKFNDFVDCLNEMMEKTKTEEYKKLGITETTVMCQAIAFFLAGFETTASTLTYVTYNLAKNPEAQEKLLAEVDAYWARHDGKVEHESIGELVYMAACIQETLRMFAPLIRLERVCNKDWYHESTGLHIPKGVVVQVPVYSIHYNEKYYPEPHAFKPERFLPENKSNLNPYAFLSFGAGSHNCIGMRFAKEELHLTLTHILKSYKFKANAETKIKFLPGRTFLIAAEPFTVDAVKRFADNELC